MNEWRYGGCLVLHYFNDVNTEHSTVLLFEDNQSMANWITLLTVHVVLELVKDNRMYH